ncbi:hypothetical protein GCM10009555_088070 [Acrocarpospora macrocephala]|uniref:Uncharacterized protein n=1 Tax=Acrocarpospora macrocephala TaxID=150177 RepID=A0A5M3X7Y9_9ACTN|nr:hypothetical protein Amac_103900 [Acrocarpospora macrocephala]
MACDFLAMDTATLRRIYVLTFVEHGSRRPHIVGVTTHPTIAGANPAAQTDGLTAYGGVAERDLACPATPLSRLSRIACEMPSTTWES